MLTDQFATFRAEMVRQAGQTQRTRFRSAPILARCLKASSLNGPMERRAEKKNGLIRSDLFPLRA